MTTGNRIVDWLLDTPVPAAAPFTSLGGIASGQARHHAHLIGLAAKRCPVHRAAANSNWRPATDRNYQRLADLLEQADCVAMARPLRGIETLCHEVKQLQQGHSALIIANAEQRRRRIDCEILQDHLEPGSWLSQSVWGPQLEQLLQRLKLAERATSQILQEAFYGKD